jgi:hypothetical protein
LALVLLPLAVSACALVFDVGTSYIAGSDQGLIELRTSDVGRHAVLVGPYARNGWNHPGPALFYALAVPYRLAGSHSIGLGLGALLINGLAISGMAIVVRRRGGLPLLLLTLVGCAVLMRSLGAAFLRDPWNPYITVLPFGLLVLVTWAMTCGEAWALPVGVGVASFCVQTHVGYAPIAIPLLVWGATWLVLTRRRRGDADEYHEKRRRDLVRAAAVAAAVLVVMWLPAAIQQLTESPGNLTEVVEDFTGASGLKHSIADGYRVVGGQFGLVPQWLTGRVELDPFSGQPLLLDSAPPPVLLIPFGVAAVASLGGEPTGCNVDADLGVGCVRSEPRDGACVRVPPEVDLVPGNAGDGRRGVVGMDARVEASSDGGIDALAVGDADRGLGCAGRRQLRERGTCRPTATGHLVRRAHARSSRRSRPPRRPW